MARSDSKRIVKLEEQVDRIIDILDEMTKTLRNLADVQTLDRLKDERDKT